MALVAASINLQFNANYAGCHRVCWRTPGVGAYPLYDCTIQVNCVGGGNTCSATIPIMVDNQSCDPVLFDGYVQACCEDIASPNGQLPFAETFTPNPNCKGYTITCEGPVGVASLVITNAGSGYVAGATVPIVISGGGGAGATANAIIGNGGVSDTAGSTTIFPFGAGYVNGTYNNVPAVTLTGIGAGALFTVVVAGNQVFSVDVVAGSNGTGYNIGDTFNFNPANLGGAGGGVVVTINTVNTGTVQNVVLTAPGAGYTSVATGTLPASGGILATVGLIMEGCSTIDLDTCGGTPILVIPNIPLGTSFVACNTSAYAFPPEYDVDQNACCYECTTITFTKSNTYTNPSSTVYYQDCDTGEMIATVLVAGGGVGPVCAINGSWFVIESNPITGTTSVTVGAACP